MFGVPFWFKKTYKATKKGINLNTPAERKEKKVELTRDDKTPDFTPNESEESDHGGDSDFEPTEAATTKRKERPSASVEVEAGLRRSCRLQKTGTF